MPLYARFVFDSSKPAHARALHRLATEEVIWLTTVTPAGQPQPSPVWFWWDGEEFWIYSGETSRVANIQANPLVALNFNGDEAGDDTAIIEAVARIDEGAPPASDVPGYVERYDRMVPAIGMTWDTFCSHYRIPIRIHPTGFRGW